MVKIEKETRKTYENLFEILYHKFNDSSKAYDHMLEFLAADNCPPMFLDMQSKLDWFFSDKDIADKLIESYNLPQIKNDRYDYLGDIFIDNVIGRKEAGRKGLYLTPQPIVDMICKMTIGDKNQDEVYVLDPCVGSGRFLITADKYTTNAHLFGIDNNLTMIRTAFTNAAIHSIRMYLLHADTLLHETDISNPEGRYNWQYANRWYSHMDKLKKINIDKSIAPKSQYQLF